MNKFNKKLTLNIPDQAFNTHEHQSPSINDATATEKQPYYQLIDGMDSESADHKLQNPAKLNFIEFEEFNVNDPIVAQQKYADFKHIAHNTDKDNRQITPKHKRNVTIQLPDRDDQVSLKKNGKKRLVKDNLQDFDNQIIDDRFKQPPAPSKGSKQGKAFVFPNSSSNMQNKPNKDTEIVEQLKQCFERQRQQFYKYKSKLEQQILIKNGQIDMLQKIVTDKYSPTNSSNSNKQNSSVKDIWKAQNYKFSEKIIQNEILQMEQIIAQKDLQVYELLQRIAYLNECLSKKTQQYNKKSMDNNCLEGVIQSLKNQLYLYEKRETNDKLTSNFKRLKKQRQSRQISRERDRDDGIEKQWEDEEMQLQMGHRDFGTKGLLNLQKRIENIHKNRIDLDQRTTKIKSDIVPYPHSTRNRPKGAFDFNARGLNKTKNF